MRARLPNRTRSQDVRFPQSLTGANKADTLGNVSAERIGAGFYR